MAIPFMIGFLDSKIKAANKREKGSYTESTRNLDFASAQREGPELNGMTDFLQRSNWSYETFADKKPQSKLTNFSTLLETLI